MCNIECGITIGGRSDDDIEKEMADIKEREEFLNSEIEKVNSKVANSPTREEIKDDADFIKHIIEGAYSAESRLGKMSFDDGRVIVERAFGAVKDDDGKRLGVYIKKDSKGEFQYEINGGIIKYIDENCPKSFLKLPMPLYALQDLLKIETEYTGDDYDPFKAKPKRKLKKSKSRKGKKQEIVSSDL